MRRRFRLRTNAQFKRVRGGGRSWAQPLAVLYALPNAEGVTRVGFSVGKRIGKAVARNRVKRLLREAVRLRLPNIKPGYDLVFIARAPIAGAKFQIVAAAVDQLLQRSRLLVVGETGGAETRPSEGRPERERSLAQEQ